MLSKLRRSYEERRISLIETLKKNKDSMELSKQHQLYGAIKEIEHFLKSIDYYEQKALDDRVKFELHREGPPPMSERLEEFWEGFSEKISKGARSTAKGVKKVVVDKPLTAVSAVKEQMRLFKEAMEEVKKKKAQKKKEHHHKIHKSTKKE